MSGMPTFKGDRVADGAFHGNDPLRPVAVACLATHGSGRIMSALGPIFVKCGTYQAPSAPCATCSGVYCLASRYIAAQVHCHGSAWIRKDALEGVQLERTIRYVYSGSSAGLLLNDNM